MICDVGVVRVNLFLAVTGIVSVMIGTILYVLGSRERNSKLKKKKKKKIEMYIPMRPIPKGDTLLR